MIEIEVKTRFDGPPSVHDDPILDLSGHLSGNNLKSLKHISPHRVENHKNHYYHPTSDLGSLTSALINFGVPTETARTLNVFGPPASVRTRSVVDFTDSQAISISTFLVVKQGEDSENGQIRTEISVQLDIPQTTLDLRLESIGLRPLAKWARTRFIYTAEINKTSVTICMDDNAGYGWIVEFEFASEALTTSMLNKLMEKVLNETGLKIIPRELMDRMYAFYNERWQQYYLTGEVFSDEDWEQIVPPPLPEAAAPAPVVTEEPEAEEEPLSISPDEPLENDITSK